MPRIDNAITETLELRLWSRRLLFVIKSIVLPLHVIVISSVYMHHVIARQPETRQFKINSLHSINFRLLYFFSISFWMLLFFVLMRKSWKNYKWWFRMFYMFSLMWISAALFWLPLLSAQTFEWYHAIIGTSVLMIIQTILVMCRSVFYDHTTELFLNWTVRGYVFSTLGVLLSIAWKSSQTDVCVAFVTLAYMIILTLVLGRTMGSEDFFQTEVEPNEYIFLVMNYFNYISVYTHFVLACCKLRCVWEQDLGLTFDEDDSKTLHTQ